MQWVLKMSRYHGPLRPRVVPTLEMVALSFAAQRVQESRTGETAKALMQKYLFQDIYREEDRFEIIDQDRTQAQEAIDVIVSEVSYSRLAGHWTSNFVSALVQELIKPEADSRSVGLFSYVPATAQDIVKRRDYLGDYTASQALGKPGDRIVIDITVFDKKEFSDRDLCLVRGRDSQGNLIKYFSSKPEHQVSGKYQARIKEAKTDMYEKNAMVTQLFYMKKVV